MKRVSGFNHVACVTILEQTLSTARCLRGMFTIGILLAASLFSGCRFGTQPSNFDPFGRESVEYEKAEELLDIWFVFRDRYPENPFSFSSPRELYESVDEPYTQYIFPAEVEAFLSLLSTNSVGMGVHIDSVDGGYRIREVFEGSPAEDAGLEKGDKIVSCNGLSVDGVSYFEFSSIVGGNAGEKRLLEIRRGDTTREITVVLAQFSFPSVVVDSLDSTTSYIALNTFLSETNTPGGSRVEFNNALSRTSWAQVSILDLRHNTGGELGQCVAIASQFVDSGVGIVRSRERIVLKTTDGQKKGTTVDSVWYSDSGGRARERVFYVLTDSLTASASEILVSCMKDLRPDITIVGTRTYGKGRGQHLEMTPRGGLVKITFSRIEPITGTSYDLVGIEPDILLDSSVDALDSTLARIRGQATLSKSQTRQVSSELSRIRALRRFTLPTYPAPRAIRRVVDKSDINAH